MYKKMTGCIEFLPGGLVILILNKFNNIDKKGQRDHPARRSILSLYLTCSKFKWLDNISITSVEKYDIDETYSTFDIFGNDIGIQLTHHYTTDNYPEYQVDMISGFEYTDLQGIYNEICVCCLDELSYDGMRHEINGKEISYEGDDIRQALENIIKQIKHQDLIFYHWLKKTTDGAYNNLLVRYKNYPKYDMKFMNVFNRFIIKLFIIFKYILKYWVRGSFFI
jgi:hypothetical protein